MSTKVASLYAEIGADVTKFEQGSKKVKGGLGDLRNAFSSILPPGITGFATLAGAVAGLSSALAWSVKQASDAQRVDAQLNAVLESTHHAAGLSADELDNMATALSRVSTYDDEAIKGSEALLLTFTGIGRDVFPEAQQAVLDMATALGTDLKSASIQVGKALQDPILGVTALRRVGVNFNAEQQEMIKGMVEAGNVMDAQKYILRELSTEFGGSAAAAANTFEGQLTQLKNEVGNLGEAFGEGLLPELSAVVTDLKDFTIFVTDNMDTIKEWGNRIMWVTGLPGKLGNELGKLTRGWLGIGEGADAANEGMEAAAYTAGSELPPAFEDAADASKELEESLKAQSGAFKQILSNMFSIQSESERYTETIASNEERLKEIEQEKVRLQMEQNGVQAAGNLTLDERNKFMLRQIELDKEASEIAADSVQALEDKEKASKKLTYQFLEQKAAQDGLINPEEFRFLQDTAVQMGLIDRASADASIAAADAADNMWSAFEKPGDAVKNVHDKLMDIPKDSPYRAQIVIETIGGIPTLGSMNTGPTLHPSASGTGSYLGGYADGGSFTVPGSGAGDRPYIVGLAPGEQVDVTPAGQSKGGNTIIINATVNGEQDWDYVAQRVLERVR